MRDLLDRTHAEQHLAFMDLVKTARRVTGALVDLDATPGDKAALLLVGQEVDRLAEVVAAIRLVVADADLVQRWRRSRIAQRTLSGRASGGARSVFGFPLIEVLRRYEAQRDGQGEAGGLRRGRRW